MRILQVSGLLDCIVDASLPALLYKHHLLPPIKPSQALARLLTARVSSWCSGGDVRPRRWRKLGRIWAVPGLHMEAAGHLRPARQQHPCVPRHCLLLRRGQGGLLLLSFSFFCLVLSIHPSTQSSTSPYPLPSCLCKLFVPPFSKNQAVSFAHGCLRRLPSPLHASPFLRP